MAIQHVSRRGDTYSLYEGRTKTGKPKYYFAKKSDGALATAIPEGFEVYESPDARVSLRKIPPKIIRDEEVAIVDRAIRRVAPGVHFRLDVQKNAIVVHQGEDSLSAFAEKLGPFGGLFSGRLTPDFIQQHLHFSPMFQFVLNDESTRRFSVERWCCRGGYDRWIHLATGPDLAALANQYCRHLGKESFFDLI